MPLSTFSMRPAPSAIMSVIKKQMDSSLLSFLQAKCIRNAQSKNLDLLEKIKNTPIIRANDSSKMLKSTPKPINYKHNNEQESNRIHALNQYEFLRRKRILEANIRQLSETLHKNNNNYYSLRRQS